MIFARLRRGDGLPFGRSWLDSVVKNLQLGLIHAGHPVSTDGKFGFGTEDAVKAFQRAQRIEPSGVVDKPTWAALAAHLQAALAPNQQEIRRLLPDFDGDLDWVHQREGHNGTAYWPGGASGVTLDPGVDLGQVDAGSIDRLYRALLSAEQCGAAKKCLGLRGEKARLALAADPILQTIRITRDDAGRLMPFTSRSYWREISARFPRLLSAGILPSVQTVFLSLAYNRGAANSDLDRLTQCLQSFDWDGIADRIGAMQQDHPLEGIRVRRRDEANLIRAEVEYLAC